MSVFGERLHMARRAAHFQQQELADVVGVASSTISCYECGTREPSLDTLLKISRCLGVTADYLLGCPSDDEDSRMDMNMDMTERVKELPIGERIKYVRQCMGISQGELSRRLGISQAAVAQWEHGIRVPKLASLMRIATALEVSVDTFTSIPVQGKGAGSEHTVQEDALLSAFRCLTEKGRLRVLGIVKDYTNIPVYTVEEGND